MSRRAGACWIPWNSRWTKFHIKSYHSIDVCRNSQHCWCCWLDNRLPFPSNSPPLISLFIAQLQVSRFPKALKHKCFFFARPLSYAKVASNPQHIHVTKLGSHSQAGCVMLIPSNRWFFHCLIIRRSDYFFLNLISRALLIKLTM